MSSLELILTCKPMTAKSPLCPAIVLVEASPTIDIRQLSELHDVSPDEELSDCNRLSSS